MVKFTHIAVLCLVERANFVKLYICGTKHKENTALMMTQSDNCVSLGGGVHLPWDD